MDAGQEDRASQAAYEPSNLGKTNLQVTHPSPLLESRGSPRTGQQERGTGWREQDLPVCGKHSLGSRWGEGREKGFIIPYLRIGAAKGLGRNLRCDPAVLDARPAAVGSGPCIPGDTVPLGAPSPVGSSFPRRLTPFCPTFPAGMCKPSRAFIHPIKGPARGTWDLGHRQSQPILPVLPTPAARASVTHRKSQDTFCFFFPPFLFFFFPFFPLLQRLRWFFSRSSPLSSRPPCLQPGCWRGWPKHVRSSAV